MHFREQFYGYYEGQDMSMAWLAAGNDHGSRLSHRTGIINTMASFFIRWLVLTVAAAVMVLLLPGMHAVGQPPILGIAAFSLFMALLNAVEFYAR